jgi:hypothetical protein
VTGEPVGAARAEVEGVVVALTAEIANYSERLANSLQCGPSELWALVLAVSGQMTYFDVGAAHAVRLGVPDTKFELWRSALEDVIDILGDPEARYRTGYDSVSLSKALVEFFDGPEPT